MTDSAGSQLIESDRPTIRTASQKGQIKRFEDRILAAIRVEPAAINASFICDKVTRDGDSRPERLTPLQYATFMNRPLSVKTLLQAGADPNLGVCHDRSCASCLYWCAATPFFEPTVSLECLRLLIQHNADPNLAGVGNETALMYAAAAGSYDIVKLLVESGADITATRKLEHGGNSDRFESALHSAAHCGHVRTAELLLASKADVNTGIWCQHESLTAILVSPLYTAAKYGRSQIVKLLVSRGANVNNGSMLVPGNYGGGVSTPIGVAAARGHQDIVRHLLRASTNWNDAAALQHATASDTQATVDHEHLAEVVDGNAAGVAIYISRKTCDGCGLLFSDLKKCGRCGQARYCSKQCQTSHFHKIHRMECKKA